MRGFELIVAMDRNRAIGKNGGIPWHIPNDLKHVQRKTTGKTLVMGRSTFESIGKPLRNRRNIVLTSDSTFSEEGIETANSVEGVLSLLSPEEEVVIFGGSKVYEAFLPYVTKMYITKVHHAFDKCDTFFPDIDMEEWEEVSNEQGEYDFHNCYSYSFHEYVKRDRE